VAAREEIIATLSDILDYATFVPSLYPHAHQGAFLAVHLFGGLLLRPFSAASVVRIRLVPFSVPNPPLFLG
jgi:hypothetical protein